jgi:hypothetical protein
MFVATMRVRTGGRRCKNGKKRTSRGCVDLAKAPNIEAAGEYIHEIKILFRKNSMLQNLKSEEL